MTLQYYKMAGYDIAQDTPVPEQQKKMKEEENKGEHLPVKSLLFLHLLFHIFPCSSTYRFLLKLSWI